MAALDAHPRPLVDELAQAGETALLPLEAAPASGGSGSIALSGGGAVTFTGYRVQQSGTISLSGGGAVTFTGRITGRHGVLGIPGGGAVAFTGSASSAAGSISISGGGAVTGAGHVSGRHGTLGLSGGGAVTATGYRSSASGSFGISGGGAVTLGGFPAAQSGAFGVTGGGAVGFIGETTGLSGTISISGGGAVTAAGHVSGLSGSFGISGGGALAFTGFQPTQSGTISLSGGGAVTTIGHVSGRHGTLTITGGGPVTVTGTSIPYEYPAPDAPPIPELVQPDGVRWLYRVSAVVPQPTLDDEGRPQPGWVASSITEEEWGAFRVVVDGVDVTRFRGVPARIDRYQLMEPFGCGPASITFPQIGPWEPWGSGDLAWLQVGADVDIVRLHPNETTTTILWSGVVPALGIKAGPGGRSTTLALIGDIWAGGLQAHLPKPYLPSTDAGVLIADTLNRGVISRRVKKVERVPIGVDTIKRGSSDQSVIDYVQELLTTYGQTEDGDQWTLSRVPGQARKYQLTTKDRSTVTATVRAGAWQDIDLTVDASETPNVIYGSGVNSDGYAWAGWVYPQADGDAYRPYPLSTDPLEVMTVGTTDADTTTGTGVTDLQERLNDLGIHGTRVAEDGVYSAADANAVKVMQRYYGLQRDGITGPQTWNAAFPQYQTNYLDGAFRLPLAYDPAVMPRLYHADGRDAGANPDYDPSTLRVSVDRQHAAGISKAEATRSAQAELDAVPAPGLVGTITLAVDPPERSKWDLREGTNITVQGLRGSNVTLHVSGVEVVPPGSADDPGQVTLTVDQYARDLLTIAAIRARDAESRQDPVRLPSRRLRRSTLADDTVVQFDGESPAGRVKRMAVIGGLWVYQDIPVSQAGQIALVELQTSPAAKFTVAFFGSLDVTPADMIAYVGADPLADVEDGFGPYDRLAEDHPEFGFVQAIGGPGQAAGYGSGYEDSPYTPFTSTPLTGKLESTAGWSYRSSRPPFLRMFVWSPDDCTIRGRLRPAPLDA